MSVTGFVRLFFSSRTRNAPKRQITSSPPITSVGGGGNPVRRLPGLPLANDHKLITHRRARQKLDYTHNYSQPRASRRFTWTGLIEAVAPSTGPLYRQIIVSYPCQPTG
jgi:hypothetical protein